MLNTTVRRLKCPRQKRGKDQCGSALQLISKQEGGAVFEVNSGYLQCQKCHSKFPILAGVALLVDDVPAYLFHHVKGITQVVLDSEIPKEYLREFLEAKAEIQTEHIEEDLEAQRVNALYFMNHYLRVNQADSKNQNWWIPKAGKKSQLIDSLVREYWDHGPFEQIKTWIMQFQKSGGLTKGELVEVGCGVGGLYPELKNHLKSYLGVDSSFASIALARHLALGMPYRGKIRIPGDLLQGSISRDVSVPIPKSYDGNADFIVGDIQNPPLKSGEWDVAVALNAIDMLDVPSQLPKLKHHLLKNQGFTIQSCPYIWHEAVAKRLRKELPPKIQDSAQAVEWLYEKVGFHIEERVEHLPWLFFKHLRQLEIYSVHLFIAKKTGSAQSLALRDTLGKRKPE